MSDDRLEEIEEFIRKRDSIKPKKASSIAPKNNIFLQEFAENVAREWGDEKKADFTERLNAHRRVMDKEYYKGDFTIEEALHHFAHHVVPPFYKGSASDNIAPFKNDASEVIQKYREKGLAPDTTRRL